MGNQLVTISDVTQRALPILANTLVFADKVNRQYDREFGQKGRKIGGTANIRLPVRYLGTFGPALNVEPSTENYMPVSVLYQFHVDMQFTTANLLLDVDDFDRRFLEPAIITVANRFDSDNAFYYYQNVANRGGTPGTRPTSYLAFSDAYATLLSEGMPKGIEPCAILHPFASSAMADSFKGLYNPQGRISEYFETGQVAQRVASADWYVDPNITSYTVGSLTSSPVLAGVTTATGGSAIVTSGWAQNGFFNLSGLGSTNAEVFVGDTISVAGLFPVNPQNRSRYGANTKQFVVLPPAGYAQMTGAAGPGGPQFATATLTNGTFNAVTGQYTSSAGGLLSVLVGEAAIISGQFQNCVGVAGTFTGTPVVTLYGAAQSGFNSTENAYFHRDVQAAVMVDLPMPRTAVEAERATDEELGISIRILTQYTINNDSEPTRLDIAYGISPLYRQLGYRVSG